jgi:hypothetical protein
MDYTDLITPIAEMWVLPLSGLPSGAAPTVTLISPALGGPLQLTTPVIVDVDAPTGIQYLALSAKMGTTWETIWREGVFSWLYETGSTCVDIIPGRSCRFTIVRRSGWRAAPIVYVDAVDSIGQQDP